MTIDRTYRCDLCSDMHKPDDGQPGRDLLGRSGSPGD